MVTPNKLQLSEPQLQAQIAHGHIGLVFEPQLEAAFRIDYFQRGLIFRNLLFLLGAMLIAVTPLYDSLLLQAPAPYNSKAHVLQFGIMIPALLAGAVFSLLTATRHFSDIITVIVSLVVGCGMLGQHLIGVRYGFDMPLEFTGLVIAASFLVARLRFWYYLPAALVLLVAAIAAEIWIVQPTPAGWYHVMATVMLVLISAIAAYVLEYVIRMAWLHECILRKWSAQDSLTGLLNRRAFDDAAQRSLGQAVRAGVNVSVAMIDLDEFKRYNDYYGHQAGDRCLQRIADILKHTARRPLDCCGRYGGEEFVVMWFDVSPDEAKTVASEVCKQVRDAHITHPHSSVADAVTLSIGVVAGAPGEQTQLVELIEQADRALYEAKAGGRNRYVVTPLSPH